MARRRNDEITWTDREPFVRRGRLLAPKKPIERPAFTCVDINGDWRLFVPTGSDATIEGFVRRWVQHERSFPTGEWLQ